MVTCSRTDLSRRSGDIIAEALRRPVTIVQHNKARLVRLSVEDYRLLLARADTRALGTVDAMSDALFEEFRGTVDACGRDGEAGSALQNSVPLLLPLPASGRIRPGKARLRIARRGRSWLASDCPAPGAGLPGAQRGPTGTAATESVHLASRRSTTRPSPRTLASMTNPVPGSCRAGPSSNEPVRKLSGVLSSTNELTNDAAIR
jgi:PHD/YefM family antitoxin component YafN of YafNO toxin-antitoxin module